MTRKPTKGDDFDSVRAPDASEDTSDLKIEPMGPFYNFGQLKTSEQKAAYRRLTTDPRSVAVIERMRSWGIARDTIDQLLRKIACSRSEWEDDVRNRERFHKRRAHMARALKEFAKECADDPHLCDHGYYTTWNPRFRKSEWKTIAEIFRETADSIEPKDDFDSEVRRKVSFETWASKALCSAIIRAREWAPWDTLPDDDPRLEERFEPASFRAPNGETATLLSVAFRLKITPDTVTQARKKVRRRYYREN